MKHFFLFTLFSIIVLTSKAQPDNWYFSFSMGVSLPQGKFGETNGIDERTGFAKKGFAMSLDGTFPLDYHWGVKGMVLLNSNPIERNGMGAMMESRMNKHFTVTGENRNFLNLETNSWLTNSIMFGPIYTINFKKMYWDIQLLGGMNVTYLPQAKLYYQNPNLNWSYLQQNTTSTTVSFGCLGGTALRFPVSENANIKFAIDYFFSNARVKYEEVKYTKNGVNTNVEELNSGMVINPMQSLSGTIGFVYYL